MTPAYSIVIAVAGRPALLERCLESVLAQTYEDREVIVVDYGAAPPIVVPAGVRLIRWEPAGGWSNPRATNIGVANAHGGRLLIINADIIMADDLLEIADDMMQEHGNCQLYWHRFDLDQTGKGGHWHIGDNRGDFLCIDRARYMAAGGYDERMEGWGAYDTDLGWRLVQLGCLAIWGKERKLLHQYHKPQARKSANLQRNLKMHLSNVTLRRLVVNEGLATFTKYKR